METEDELLREMTAFWGGVHSRFEWLLDTQVHFYHNRGQLHAMLVHMLKREQMCNCSSSARLTSTSIQLVFFAYELAYKRVQLFYQYIYKLFVYCMPFRCYTHNIQKRICGNMSN